MNNEKKHCKRKRSRLKRMLDRRIFLFLLLKYRNSRRKYLSVEEYASIVLHGVDEKSFIRFAHDNWSVINVFLIFLHLKPIEKESPSLDGTKALQGIHSIDMYFEAREYCKKNKLIKDENEKINISHPGKRYIKFLPFWNLVCKKYKSLELTLTGGIIGLVISSLLHLLK